MNAKKGGLLLFSAVLIGTAVYLRFKDAPADTTPTVVEKGATAISMPDSDGDGLRDWEETLWGTNKDKKDSDGDGTNDGDEVLANRNPAVAGPNDVMAAKPKEAPRAENVSAPYAYAFDENLGKTPTERLALNLAANYLSARAGGALAENEKQELLANIVADTQENLPAPTRWSAAGINEIETDEETLRDYYNELGMIWKRTVLAVGSNELDIMEAARASGDLKNFAPLAPIGRSYTAAAKAASVLSVPDILATHHLRFINALAAAAWGLEQMGGSTDPTAVLVGFNAYRLAYGDFSKISTSIFAPLTSGDVALSVSDPGYIFKTQ